MEHTRVEEKQLIVHGLLVTYYVEGVKNKANTYVVLHGWGSQSSHLFSSLHPLSRNSRLIFVDLPGFGKSEPPPEAWGLDEYSSFVAEFLKGLDIKKVHAIGHSFGGSIALFLAYEKPTLIESLILISSAGIRKNSKRLTITKKLAHIVSPIFRFPYMQSLRRSIYKTIGSEDYVTLPGMRESYKRIISRDISHILSKIRQKTLIIWGEDDTATPLENGTYMEKTIPDASLHIISHAGHFCFLDRPGEFKNILTTYAKS